MEVRLAFILSTNFEGAVSITSKFSKGKFRSIVGFLVFFVVSTVTSWPSSLQYFAQEYGLSEAMELRGGKNVETIKMRKGSVPLSVVIATIVVSGSDSNQGIKTSVSSQ